MVLVRDKRLNVLVSEEEMAMVQALADGDGVAVSDYVRTFIRRAHADAFGDKPSRIPKR